LRSPRTARAVIIMPPRDAAGGAPRLAVIALLPLLVHLSTCGDLDPCRLPRIRSPLCRCKCRCGCPTCSHLLLTRTCPTTRLPPRAQLIRGHGSCARQATSTTSLSTNRAPLSIRQLDPRGDIVGFPEDTRVVSPRVFHVTRKLSSAGIGDRVDELELTVLNSEAFVLI
jgi:hypothetical protein